MISELLTTSSLPGPILLKCWNARLSSMWSVWYWYVKEMPKSVRCRIKETLSARTRMLQHWTEMRDAGMPMLAASTWMPMPSYACCTYTSDRHNWNYTFPASYSSRPIPIVMLSTLQTKDIQYIFLSPSLNRCSHFTTKTLWIWGRGLNSYTIYLCT